MRFFVSFLILFLAFFPAVFSRTSVASLRQRRSINPGVSHYDDVSVQNMQTIRLQHYSTGLCLEPKGRVVVTSACETSKTNQLFRMEKEALYSGMLKHVDSGLCLSLATSSDEVQLTSCSAKNKALNVWKCHFPYVKQGKSWLERDWAGMTTVSPTGTKKCVTVTSDRKVKAKDCTIYGKNQEQRIFVYGKKFMGVCAPAGNLGPRTNSTDYYYFNHPKFALSWSIKYIEVYMVYNNGIYNAFRNEYGTHAAAMAKIRQHALDSLNIVDKMYYKAKIRVILTGFEVWDKKDLANTGNTTSSWEVHGNFRAYSRKLRLEKGLKYDLAIHVFDKDLYGAAGTASSSYCSQSSWNEVFTMVTLGGRGKILAKSLANVLTHEMAHHFRAGHNFDPEYTCPTYHLFGGRCTLGGNDWPKAFSMGEFDSIRYYYMSGCLDNKPDQSAILGCGNGVIEPGEECDCGISEDCKKRNPCCDGSICKLKRDIKAECSSERCCTNCKFDATKSGCAVSVQSLQGKDFGVIDESKETVNQHKTWRITVSNGKRITLVMDMMNFEFDEGCPFDYIEVRDGGSSTSPLIGRYCRTPPNMHVQSSSNQLYITYRGDSTFPSRFKLFYTAAVANTDDSREVIIKSLRDNKCFSSDYSKSKIAPNSGCQERFIWTNQFYIKHVGTGLCLKPDDWYGSYYTGYGVKFTGDCSSHHSVFFLTSQGTILHAISGFCLQNNGYSIRTSNCGDSSSLKFSVIAATGPTQPPPTTRPPVQGNFRIRHYSKKCFKYEKSDNKIHLSSNCDDLYHIDSSKRLVHTTTRKCVSPVSSGDNSLIALTDSCDDNAMFESTSFGSLRHVRTGSCVHPLNGAMYPKEGQFVVIYRGCDSNRLKFTLEPVKPQLKTFTIKHYSGLCVSLRTSDNLFRLDSTCNDKFALTSSNALKQIQSGKCVMPLSANNDARISLTSSCDDVSARFQQTASFSMKHLSTGKCVHPHHGALHPSVNTNIVIYSGCDENRLQFKFIYDQN